MKRVADIMQKDVATIRPEATLRELTSLLSDRGISGAPVISETGALLGVVSATDLVRRAAVDGVLGLPDEDSGRGGDTAFQVPNEPDWTVVDWSRLEMPDSDRLTVEDIMTPVGFGVSPDASIREVAEFLVRGRIHRALVVRGQDMVGLVTTMDVLRAVADGVVAAD